MAEEKKALSCPFCGGRSHHILGARQIRMPDVVNCLDCFAEIQGTYEPESALIKWNTRAQLPSQGGGCRPLGYMNKKDIARLQDEITWDGSYLTVGIDHWAQWQEDTPYDHLQAIYTHPADQVEDDLTMVKVSRELLEDLRDCANECYNHARMRGTSGLEHYENLTEQADALLAKSEGVKK